MKKLLFLLICCLNSYSSERHKPVITLEIGTFADPKYKESNTKIDDKRLDQMKIEKDNPIAYAIVLNATFEADGKTKSTLTYPLCSIVHSNPQLIQQDKQPVIMNSVKPNAWKDKKHQSSSEEKLECAIPSIIPITSFARNLPATITLGSKKTDVILKLIDNMGIIDNAETIRLSKEEASRHSNLEGTSSSKNEDSHQEENLYQKEKTSRQSSLDGTSTQINSSVWKYAAGGLSIALLAALCVLFKLKHEFLSTISA